MLNLDQDKFMTDFVTIYLATDAAKTADIGKYMPPVHSAIACARIAWFEMIGHFGMPMPSRFDE